MSDLSIAVLIPCYNEVSTIRKVVSDFSTALPDAHIYVYDNNSTDGTAKEAFSAGAIVRAEPLQGKGNVIRRMLSDVDADIYVLVDGDDTYDAADAGRLIGALLSRQLDMVNGRRIIASKAAFRPGHQFGNAMLTSLVGWFFGRRLTDMLSGYKVLSRRFVKSFPALSAGFETETELAVHALELRMPIAEIDTAYRERPHGSASKLHTVRDGVRILRTIVKLVKEERPLPFFIILFCMFLVSALAIGIPIIIEFIDTGLVPRLPSAVLAMGLSAISFIFLACGLILDTVTHGRREMKRLHYLSIAAPPARAINAAVRDGKDDAAAAANRVIR